MPPRVTVLPTLETTREVLETYQACFDRAPSGPKPPNLVPLCATIPADLLTPSLAYLKVSGRSKSELSFLFESAATTETIGRYSFVGADPRKVLKTGAGHGPECDPLPILEAELAQFRVATIPGLTLPPLTGGAIGYVGYDCVRYFEPKTARPMKDVLNVPESLFMLYDTIIAFDHFFQTIKVITYLAVPPLPSDLPSAYSTAHAHLTSLITTLSDPAPTPLPRQPPILPHQPYVSNIGRPGYTAHVRALKRHITAGDIIQAVPSQRLSRRTTLHPFNIYRHLRTVNPSPYLFYIACGSFHLVGASPELLVKLEPSVGGAGEGGGGRVVTHPIAGTVPRGKTPDQDAALAATLRASLKDRAEHVMLVDLARNDLNRVCHPRSVRVDRLMVVERFSHVQHLVSQVSGDLRAGMTRWDAFRSVFPAGTVSGAPKVRAMELIAELEREKRGVYAGAVGWWGYGSVALVKRPGSETADAGSETAAAAGRTEEDDEALVLRDEQGPMDTCIALRTMLVKDGHAYLQAGGGIVFDSDEGEEWVETLNKLGANVTCVEEAERRFSDLPAAAEDGADARVPVDWRSMVEVPPGAAAEGKTVAVLVDSGGEEKQMPTETEKGVHIDLGG